MLIRRDTVYGETAGGTTLDFLLNFSVNIELFLKNEAYLIKHKMVTNKNLR